MTFEGCSSHLVLAVLFGLYLFSPLINLFSPTYSYTHFLHVKKHSYTWYLIRGAYRTAELIWKYLEIFGQLPYTNAATHDLRALRLYGCCTTMINLHTWSAVIEQYCNSPLLWQACLCTCVWTSIAVAVARLTLGVCRLAGATCSPAPQSSTVTGGCSAASGCGR